MPHAYTEDQLAEQPATGGKAEGSMLKVDVLSPEALTAADELSCARLTLRRLSGLEKLNAN